MWPHGLQPAKLLCPWTFPGKNTGVGCCFLLRRQILYRLSYEENPIIYVSESESRSVLSYSFRPQSPWNFSGQNTGVGSLSLHQGIFPTQGLNPGLLHCRQILYWLSHRGSPRILEWVAYPFSSGSSLPRNQPRVSCIAGGFFTNWAMREAHLC